MLALWDDARYGLRLLKREPGVPILAMLTIALGVGATTTLFSVTYGVLLRPLPWHESERLVRLSESRQGHEPRIRGTITNGTYVAWHAQPSTIEEIGGWRMAATTAMVGDGGESVRLQTAWVTPSLFAVLRAQPPRGRLFVEDDGRPGGSYPSKDVIILSYGVWQEWFGGRDDAVGSVVRVGGKPLTVVGVMPK
jgi:putative ABC transport system permease protein